MIDNDKALDLIEQAQSRTLFCACGQPTHAVGRAGGVWLECISIEAPRKSLLRRILAVDIGVHTRELIVDLSPELSAA